MGAKSWMLIANEGPAAARMAAQATLDERGTMTLVQALFPDDRPVLEGAEDLSSMAPRDGQIVAGCFEGAWVVAAEEFALDYPSRLPSPFIAAASGRDLALLARHSVVDWCAFAVWRNGILVRALSVSPDHGVLEDIGEKLEFELPFWAGQRPAVDPEDEEDEYPLPFHPLELAEAANEHFLGFCIEGVVEDWHIDPSAVPMLRFTRGGRSGSGARAARKPWWKFW